MNENTCKICKLDFYRGQSDWDCVKHYEACDECIKDLIRERTPTTILGKLRLIYKIILHS